VPLSSAVQAAHRRWRCWNSPLPNYLTLTRSRTEEEEEQHTGAFPGDKRPRPHEPAAAPALNGASLIARSSQTLTHTYTGGFLYPGSTHTHDSAAHVATHANVPEPARPR